MKLQLPAVLIAACLAATLRAPAAGPESNARVPILLELFTSEGCSSCPPADRLLESLDRQPLTNADLIVASEHVDYWNNLGWSDPYSSAVFSARQKNYSNRLGTDIYTPQLVIDGHLQATGSDQTEVLQNIAVAVRNPKLPLTIHATQAGAGLIRVEAVGASASASLYVIVAADHARSQVLRGENGGQRLSHVAVAQSIVKIGKWTGGAMTQDVPALSKPLIGETRVIAVLTEPSTGRVLAAAQTRI